LQIGLTYDFLVSKLYELKNTRVEQDMYYQDNIEGHSHKAIVESSFSKETRLRALPISTVLPSAVCQPSPFVSDWRHLQQTVESNGISRYNFSLSNTLPAPANSKQQY
jgi:hypothetical protein